MESILVIDGDESFLDSLRSESPAPAAKFIFDRTIVQGVEKINDKSLPLSGIFISANFDSTDVFRMLQGWISNRYGTPVFIIHETAECPISEEQMAQMGIKGALRKPMGSKTLIEAIEKSQNEGSGQKQPDGQEETEISQGAKDSDFHAIKAGIFMAGHRSDFDIYIKVGGINYVKVIHLGDSLDRARLDKYLSRGVVDFYIRKDAQVSYLNYCNEILSKILPHRRVPFAIKAAQVFNYGEQTIALVKSFGLSADSLAYCKGSVELIQSLIKSVDKVDSPAIRTFFNNAVAFEHGVATAVFAGLIGRASPFYIDRKADVVLLGGLLHDIGLLQLPAELQDENESTMSAEQKDLYRSHPTLGANILSSVRSIPEIVVQAVRQHHERRNGKGFPAQNLKGQSNLVAEVIGLGDEFLRFVKSDAGKGFTEGKRMNSVALAEILKGFSPNVVDVFVSVFLAQDLPAIGEK